jgi:hypothetical protein
MAIFLIGIIVLGAVMFALISGVGQPKRSKFRTNQIDRELVLRRWGEIQVKLHKGGDSALSSAVTDADKLLDYALRQSGYYGNTFAERLKQADYRLTDKEAVWRAHKLRNAIAHEVGHDIRHNQVQTALSAYEHALKDLGAMS